MTIADHELRRLRSLAKLLDSAIAIPGTSFRFGLDPILGLIPGGGDIAGAALAGFIVLVALRDGAPAAVVWRMLANVGIDTVIGSVPILGDLFDFAYKSNMKNVDLLEAYAAQPARVEKRSRWLGIAVVAVLLLLLVTMGVASFLLARLVWHLLTTS